MKKKEKLIFKRKMNDEEKEYLSKIFEKEKKRHEQSIMNGGHDGTHYKALHYRWKV